MSGSSGFGVKVGSGQGLKYGGIRASGSPTPEHVDNDAGYRLPGQYVAGDNADAASGRMTVTVNQGQGPLAALGAAGLNAEQQRAMYGQLLQSGQIRLNRDGVPIVQPGQQLEIDLNDMSGAKVAGRAIAAESSARAARAEAQAQAATQANEDNAYALRMSGGPRGGTGVTYGDAPLVGSRMQLAMAESAAVSPGYKAVSSFVGMFSDGLGVAAGAAITATGVGLTGVPEPTTLTKWAGVPLIAYGATYTTKSAVGFGLNATNFVSAIRGLTDESAYLPGSLLELGVRVAGGSPNQERLAAATDMAWGLANGRLLDARLATGVITDPHVAALLQPATLTSVSREAALASPQAWQAWNKLDPKAGMVDWAVKSYDNIIQPEFISPKK